MSVPQVRQLNSPEDLQAWDHFVDAHPSGEFCHYWGYAKACQSSWLQPFVLGCFQSERLVGGALIFKVGRPKFPLCLYYAPRGLLTNNQEAFSTLLQALVMRAKRDGAIYLKTDPAKDISECENYFDAGFVPYHEEGYPGLLHPRFEAVVSLTGSEEDVFASFKSPMRRGIRKAEKSGITVQQETLPDGLDAFYDIYRIIAEHNHFYPRDRSFIDALQSTLGKQQLQLFTARQQDKIIAAILVATTQSRSWLLYGGALSEYNSVRPANLLHWHIIRWSQMQGHTSCSFRGVPGVTVHSNNEGYGLWKFKMGFKPTIHSWTPALELAFRPEFYLLAKELETGTGKAIVTSRRIKPALHIIRWLRHQLR